MNNIEQAVEEDKVVKSSQPIATKPLPVQQPTPQPVQQQPVQQPAQQPAANGIIFIIIIICFYLLLLFRFTGILTFLKFFRSIIVL